MNGISDDDVKKLANHASFQKAIWKKELKVAQGIAIDVLQDTNKANKIVDIFLGRDKK